MERVIQRLGDATGRRYLTIVISCLLVVSTASVGQINSRKQSDIVNAGRQSSDDLDTSGLAGSDDGAAPDLGDGDAAAASGGVPGVAGAGRGTAQGGTGVSTPGGTIPPVDFGLRTQGISATEIKLGMSYNTTGCGDAGALEASLGASVVGDYKKAIEAFTRHVNDNGGIAGRRLRPVIADDGGGGCPEKALAAARQLVDDEKVFAVIPGLHEVSDYVASKKIPTYIGRDDPASLKRIGANGIGLIQEIEGNLTAWAAFGRHYLSAHQHKPCLIHPESGVSGDWNLYEGILNQKMSAQGLKFIDTVVYKEDASKAQEQASAAALRLKDKGCDQVWFMAGNPIAAIFFTQAATQAQWFPLWTFTSYMVLSDEELAGRLMDQQQWRNAVGLSTRVKPGEHPKEGNCKRIYERYYPGDGQSDSASVKLVCALVLSAVETMKRGMALTGKLDANALVVGADAINADFYYDAHVPLDWRFPRGGPYKTKGWSHYTPVKWNTATSAYDFPEYPLYWEVMGPGRSGAVDLRPSFKNAR
jgi:hypothetical protein